ncbi:unnamed protein product [Urochloa humidicola]
MTGATALKTALHQALDRGTRPGSLYLQGTRQNGVHAGATTMTRGATAAGSTRRDMMHAPTAVETRAGRALMVADARTMTSTGHGDMTTMTQMTMSILAEARMTTTSIEAGFNGAASARDPHDVARLCSREAGVMMETSPSEGSARAAEFSPARHQENGTQDHRGQSLPSAAAMQSKAAPELQDQAAAPRNVLHSNLDDKVREITSAVASLQSGMNLLQRHLLSQLERLQAQQHQWMASAEAWLRKAEAQAGQMGLNKENTDHETGNAAWSATIPAHQVFSRLRRAMPPEDVLGGPAMEDVHLGLQRLDLAVQEGEVGQVNAAEVHAMEVDSPADVNKLLHADAGGKPQVADLFTTPEPPILPQLPQRRQRARRTFDMTAVRRSARLARKPVIPSIEKAQQNLYHKLGVSTEEFATIEQVLQQYVNTIGGPLPEYVIAALTTFLDLDDTDADLMTKALIEQAGEGLEDMEQRGGLAIQNAT